MNNVVFELEPGESNVKLAPIGDFHLGHRACQKEKLLKDIKFLAKNNYYTILMGDLLDNVIPFVKEQHYYLPEVDPELSDMRSAVNYLEWLIKPLKKRLIGMHMGNHDFDWIRKCGYNYVEQLCQNLNVNYLDFESFITLNQRHGAFNTTIFSTHGSYNGRRIGGKVNRIEDLSAFFDADIYLMGHTHELAGWRRIVLTPYGGKTIQRKKTYALTGSYLLSHGEVSTYAERKGYLPNKIGMLSIEINTVTRDMHIKE